MTQLTRGVGTVYQPTYADKQTGERKISAIWWLKFYVHGKPERESSGETSRAKAIDKLKARLGELGSGDFISVAAKRTTLEDLAGMLRDDYRINGRKSGRRAQEAIVHLRDYFGADRHAHTITPDRITRYIVAREDAAAAPATIRYELSILRRMFRLGLRAGQVARTPYIPSLQVSNTRTGFFEAWELRAVCARLPAAAQPVVEFLYLTGWRIGEVLDLPWRQVDFKAGIVRLEPGTTKNDDGRVFPFAVLPALAALLQRQRERVSSLERATGRLLPHVFCWDDGRPIQDFRGAWDRACTAAGVAGRLVHDFRRTAVRNLERAGVSRSVAMKLTGHKTESIYRRYAIVSETDLAEGVAKLARFHATDRAEPVVTTLHAHSGKVRAKSAVSAGSE